MADTLEPGDRVHYRKRTGTIDESTTGAYPYRVRFEDGSFGRFSAAELGHASEPTTPATTPKYGEYRARTHQTR